MRKLTIGLLISIFMVGNSFSFTPSFGKGSQAFYNEDYETSFRHFKGLVDNGDTSYHIAGLLAYHYYSGKGVKQSYKESAYWYNKCAIGGNDHCQFKIGDLYLRGRGVPKNDVIASKWFKLSAIQGNSDSQIKLGSLYLIGKGVPQDYILGYMWLNVGISIKEYNNDGLIHEFIDIRNRTEQFMENYEIKKAQELSYNCINSNYKNCENY